MRSAPEVRQTEAIFAEMRERLVLARYAWAEAREEGHVHVSAGLARIAGRDLGADQSPDDTRADAIRDRFKQVLGRDKPDPRQEQERKLWEEREKQRQSKLERQPNRDNDLGWEL